MEDQIYALPQKCQSRSGLQNLLFVFNLKKLIIEGKLTERKNNNLDNRMLKFFKIEDRRIGEFLFFLIKFFFREIEVQNLIYLQIHISIQIQQNEKFPSN